MSKESTTPDLVERTRQVFDAASRPDRDAVLSFFAPDAVMGSTGRIEQRGVWCLLWVKDLISFVLVYLDPDQALVDVERLAEERG